MLRPRAPLSLRGSHASPPWVLEEFYCFFMDFLLLLMAFFPPGALPGSPRRSASPGCHLPVLCRCPCEELGSVLVPLLPELNGVVAVADVGLLGGQCWKETQSSRGSSADDHHLPPLAPVPPPDPPVVPGGARRCQQGCDRVCSWIRAVLAHGIPP